MESQSKSTEMRYERTDDGLYILRDHRGLQLVSTRCPAVLYDRDTGTLHKHGDFSRIRKIALDMRAKYARIGSKDLAECLIIHASRTFDIDELNRCISIAGYCKVMHDKLVKQ